MNQGRSTQKLEQNAMLGTYSVAALAIALFVLLLVEKLSPLLTSPMP